MSELRFWAKTNELSAIIIRLVDETGQTHQQQMTLANTAEWQQIRVTSFNSGNSYTHFGGANDGQWHGAVTGIAFIIQRNQMKNAKSGTIWLDKITAITPAPVLDPSKQEINLWDYEADEGWKLVRAAAGTPPVTPGGLFEYDSTLAHSGSRSAKLYGDFSSGGLSVQIKNTMRPLEVSEVRFWTKTVELSAIIVRLIDETGQTHQQQVTIPASTQWQQIKLNTFDSGQAYTHFGGANDGQWHGKLTGIAFIIQRGHMKNGATSGTIWLDDISAIAPIPAIDIEQTQLGNIFMEPEVPAFDIKTLGNRVTWSVYDYWGESIAQGQQAVASNKANIVINGLPKGYMKFHAKADLDGVVLATQETPFALLSPIDLLSMDESPFGVVTHYAKDEPIAAMKLLAKAGIKNNRDEMYWADVEKTKGVYEFLPQQDYYMHQLEQQHIEPLIIFSFRNPLYDDNHIPYTTEGHVGFANYGKAVLDHFGDKIASVEVYNEFNNLRLDEPANASPDVYFDMLKTTYETVKADHPNVNVVGAVANGIPLNWFKRLFELGGLKYMDTLSLHPYVYPFEPESITSNIEQLKSLIRQYNHGELIPIWFSEQGFPTHDSVFGISEEKQAEYLIRSYVTAFDLGIERQYWYNFINKGTDRLDQESNFGILYNERDIRGSFTPKPAYVAYAVMARQLLNFSFVRKEEVGQGINSYLFAKGSDAARLIWAQEAPTIALSTNQSVRVVDMMGKEDVIQPLAGKVYLTVSESPVYVMGVVDQITPTGFVGLFVSSESEPGTVDLAFTLDNSLETQPHKLELEAGGKRTLASANAGEKVIDNIKVVNKWSKSDGTLFGYLWSDNNLVGKLSVPLQLKKPIAVHVKHVLVNDEDRLRLSITNQSSKPYELTAIDWEIASLANSKQMNVTMDVGTTSYIELPIPLLQERIKQSVNLNLRFANEADVTYAGTIVVWNQSDIHAIEKQTIEIGGSFNQLSGLSSIHLLDDGLVLMNDYHGAEDLSGDAWINWDEDQLYLSFRIHDDVFSHNYVGADIWQGDSIQVAIMPGLPGEGNEYYEYGLSMSNDDARLYLWSAPKGKPRGLVNGGLAYIKRDEVNHDTYYQMGLPWTSIAPISAEDGVLSLSFLVNDNDGTNRKGWIEWGSGIGSSKVRICSVQLS
ncbi:sugar-binding protein [Paenibacillus sp. N3.4]|uniref:sugar-binding protein n=1 Tax=Paenibacillus sp. N3.4 TaxID=2603222 RepID=UPI0011CACD93|nr:sugar-binding protein [Paenibacillus sp. N3.4]TXK78374.1 hypothetical protein FU659_20405 [Paenibacillus sp. N3.4]